MGMKEEWERRQAIAAHLDGTARSPLAYEAKWKDPGISRENAERINKKGRGKVHEQALVDLFKSGFIGTADEAGERLGLNPFQVRPICTHLRQHNIIERTPERRIGAGGGTAAVLKIKG